MWTKVASCSHTLSIFGMIQVALCTKRVKEVTRLFFQSGSFRETLVNNMSLVKLIFLAKNKCQWVLGYFAFENKAKNKKKKY